MHAYMCGDVIAITSMHVRIYIHARVVSIDLSGVYRGILLPQ